MKEITKKKVSDDVPYLDLLVISREGTFFNYWSSFITLICIISAYIYMFIAAFNIPEKNSTNDYLDSVFNGVFLIDCGLRFFVDYKDRKLDQTIRKQPELAMNYLRTDLFYDSITTVPFVRIINPSKHMV